MIKFFGFLFVFFLLGLGGWYYFTITYPTTSQINAALYFAEHIMKPHANLNKNIIGFLPYWRVDDIKYARLDVLSEVNYFSFTPEKDGTLLKVTGNETEPGFREWDKQTMRDFIAKTQIMGAKFTITVAALNNDLITSILDDPQAQQTLINEIVQLLKINKLDGVTIDFEYFGEPETEYQTKFTEFSQNLSRAIKTETSHATLSLALMPRAARDKDIYDFPRIVPLYDRFIGMSYDYYGANADIAGPVAPMKGFKDNKYFFDIETTYEDYEKFIPKNKLIMGVPYYGWDWAVVDGKTINSRTLPQDNPNNSAEVISYGRMREDKSIISKQCKWDDYALATWCWYTNDNGVDHQAWFEDNKSLGIKFDFAKQQHLDGIAIWVLGYDKDYPDLWNLLKEKFSTNNR